MSENSKKIVAIVGTYRPGHVIDTAVDEVLAGAEKAGARTEKIMLLDKHIEFCTNCRACTQEPGQQRGKCPIEDDMAGILDTLDAADGIVFASPINFGTVTALMKRFIERFVCYAYWPWDVKKPPNLRIKQKTKPAALVMSSMCPAFIGRWMMSNSFKTMKQAACCLGARPVAKLYFGLVAISADDALNKKQALKAFQTGQRLANAL